MARTQQGDKIITYMEEFLGTAARRYCEQEKITYSQYIRRLIIEDLRKKGLLTDKMIAENLC